jgi:uncharacterized cupin superfamily protein
LPKIDPSSAPQTTGSRYPSPYDEPCRARTSAHLGLAAGLTQFGVNLVTLPPGDWSSQRHWHHVEDEFVFVVSGELVLVEDEGETVLRAGDSAGFKAGVQNGHHLVNRSAADAVILAVGTRDDADHGEYSDIDMRFLPGRYSGSGGFMRKDGTRY